MSCPGLHCPGCSGAQTGSAVGAAGIGLLLAWWTVPWVAERIWWIVGTMAVCFALAVATSIWLERLAGRRGARYAAAHGILSRADVILPEPAIREQLTDSGRPAIALPQVVFNFYGPLDAGQAAIIRQALPGTAGDAITKGEDQP